MDIERALAKTSMGYIHYRAAGNGKPIVLLHMNQQSSAMYLELMAVLAPELRAIAIDYPSHGMSDHVTTQPTINDYARCVLEVMDALELKTANFLGESGGAVICVERAAAFADRVDKIVMVNSPWYPDNKTATRNHGVLKSGARPSDASGLPTIRRTRPCIPRSRGWTASTAPSSKRAASAGRCSMRFTNTTCRLTCRASSARRCN